MKAGTLIFLIVVILIAFGFVLSDGLQTHQDVQELMNKLDDLNAELEQARTQLVACQGQGAKDTQTIHDMQRKIDELEAHIKDLNDQLAKLNVKITVYEAQKPFLDLLTDNPLLLIAAIAAQIAASTLWHSKKLDIRWPEISHSEDQEYVLLSREEREWIIHTRRNKKDRRL